MEGVFHNYSAAFLLLVGLSAFSVWDYLSGRVAWFGLVWVALAVLYVRMARPKPAEPALGGRTIGLLLAATVAFALVVRFLPQAHTSIPIGYDYGFYKRAMETYEGASPMVPEAGLAPWIRLQFEPGILLLHQALHEVAGLDAYTHLRTLFPLFSAFLCIPVYAAARAFFGPFHGLVAAAFYAASFAQYTVHEYLYEKNVLGLALLLALLICLRNRRWAAAGLLLGALGITHRPTTLLAAATFATVGAYDVYRRREWKGWATTAGLGLALFLPVWILRSDEYFGLGILTITAAGDNFGHAVPEGGGTFLSFLEYQNAAVAYLPLALAGALVAFRRATLPALAFLLAFLNVGLRFVFYNRFIIMLDLLGLLLVGAALVASVPGKRAWLRPTVVAALLVFAAVPTLREATAPPGPPYLWLSDDQREGVFWMRDHLPANATVLASNLDAPYVIADSGLRTYGPGLFDDPHNALDWRLFFTSQDPDFVREFLRAYGPGLYVFHAEGHGAGLGTSKFRAPDFELVYDEKGAKVWRLAG